MKFLSVAVTALCLVLSQGATVLSSGNYASSVASGHWFVKYFAPWCGHCKRLAPTWDQLSEQYSGVHDVHVATVDCTVEKSICSEQGIKGYPTLKFFSNGQEVEKYSGARTFEALSKFITDKTGRQPLTKDGTAEL